MTATRARGLLAGAILWVLNIQYFVTQAVVASAWTKDNGYSWTHNTISDLANTRCGQYGARLVCSPLDIFMNISFVLLGATIIGGAFLLQKELARDFVGRLGFGCMAAAGVGAILVGLAPENSVSSIHITGAALSFLLGNLGMMLLGFNLNRLPRTLRIYTTISGVIGLIALLLFMKRAYLGLGIGGMERIVAYPQTIWMIVFGVYLLVDRYSKPER